MRIKRVRGFFSDEDVHALLVEKLTETGAAMGAPWVVNCRAAPMAIIM
jgi:hypothetical protein